MIRIKKSIKITIISVIAFVILVVLIASPLTKYLIQKHDKKITGREITIERAYTNLFTGHVYLSGLTIYEHNSDSVFLSAKGLGATISLFKLFSNTVELSEATLDSPKGYVIQNKKEFNFSDLIEKFSTKKDAPKKKKKNPVHVSILNIRINDGEFHYHELVTPINYFIKHVNIQSDGFRWDSDTIPIEFSLESGIGKGYIHGKSTLNTKNKDYALAIQVKAFDLNIVGQYIKDLSNYGSFKAILDADFQSKGNFIDRENVTNSGKIQISDFHFGKTPQDDYASFDKLIVAIKEISPKKFIYSFDSISLHQPYFKFEKYDSLDNVQTMLGKKGSKVKNANSQGAQFNLVIEIARYMKIVSKNLLRSNYQANRIGVYNGEFTYNDFSLEEKFSITLNPLNFSADSVSKDQNRVHVHLGSGIKPYGNLSVKMGINPKDSSDFDLTYQFQKIPVTAFNPYLIKYTSFPLDRGSIDIKGTWHVSSGEIKSDNHLIILDPRIGNRLKTGNTKWLPMRFFMFFVRERGNVIDYEIPINGNLKNPKFKLKDVILDALGNVFIKPATTPYRMEVKTVETKIETSLMLKWDMHGTSLSSEQEEFLDRLRSFLDENPKATVSILPKNYREKEKEYILLYEAKKKFYQQLARQKGKSFDEDDSLNVENLSIKDPDFLDYLHKKAADPLLFTVQERCEILLEAGFVDKKHSALLAKREQVFLDFFRDDAYKNRLQIKQSEAIVPYDGFSYYKIDYTGKFPDYLLRAYKKMNKLNNEAPRKKFKRFRR